MEKLVGGAQPPVHVFIVHQRNYYMCELNIQCMPEYHLTEQQSSHVVMFNHE